MFGFLSIRSASVFNQKEITNVPICSDEDTLREYDGPHFCGNSGVSFFHGYNDGAKPGDVLFLSGNGSQYMISVGLKPTTFERKEGKWVEV